MGHLTCDTWQVTSDTWHVTRDTWHMVWWDEHYEKICWSIAFTVWEWLKSDMLHLTHDTRQVVSKCIIFSPRKYKTTRLVSKLSIIRKSNSILLKLDLHYNLPNFRNVSNTSEMLHSILAVFMIYTYYFEAFYCKFFKFLTIVKQMKNCVCFK